MVSIIAYESIYILYMNGLSTSHKVEFTTFLPLKQRKYESFTLATENFLEMYQGQCVIICLITSTQQIE